MRLRAYREGDEEGIFKVVKDVLATYGLKTNPEVTDKDLANIQESYIGRGGAFSVLEHEGKIVGSCGVYPMSKDTCELRKMYLDLKFQGRGFGVSMLEDAIANAKHFGFTEMILETNSVLKKATKLYEQFGFQRYKPDHLSDRCDFAMRLTL